MIEIEFEQIIAGAFLRFDVLDPLDLNLIIKQFEQKRKCKVLPYKKSATLKEYFNIRNDGKITLNSYYADIVSEEKLLLKSELKEIAGQKVEKFFDDFNIESHTSKKKKTLTEYKSLILEKANVLLISDREEDYKALKKYGFKKIDHIKSIIRAEKYFQKHPEALQRYHIAILGNQDCLINSFGNKTKLESKLEKFQSEGKIFLITIYKYENNNILSYSSNLYDYKNNRRWSANEKTYFDLFNRITECSVINDIINNPNVKPSIYPEYEDHVRLDSKALPKRKNKLRILFLDFTDLSDESRKSIAKTLGLKVEFRKDNNTELGHTVRNELAYYDIIIASNLYSKALLKMNIESTEQCKDVDRNLTLLITYNIDPIFMNNVDNKFSSYGIGNQIGISYCFGGPLACKLKDGLKSYQVLTACNEFIPNQSLNHQQSKSIIMKSILETSVNIYNNALLDIKLSPLEDLEFRTPEDYAEEYELAEKKEYKKIAQKQAIIKEYDVLKEEILKYQEYKKSGLIDREPENIIITETESHIFIEIIKNNHLFSAINFPKENSMKDSNGIRIFSILNASLTSSYQVLSFHSKKYDEVEGIPSEPNREQLKTILFIRGIIKHVIIPLNEQANLKKQEKRLLKVDVE